MSSEYVSAKQNDMAWQEFVRTFIDSLSYGKVEIVVHDSQIVGFDTTERIRFANGGLPVSSSDSDAHPPIHSIQTSLNQIAIRR